MQNQYMHDTGYGKKQDKHLLRYSRPSLRGFQLFTVIVVVLLTTGCLAAGTFEISWTVEGTVTFEEGHDPASTTFKIGAFMTSYSTFDGYSYDYSYLGAQIGTPQTITEGSSYSFTIDFIDTEYGATGNETIYLYIWEDDDGNGIPSYDETYYYPEDMSTSDVYYDSRAVFSYVDSRGWTIGYNYDYSLFGSDNQTHYIQDGDVISGVNLRVPYFDYNYE